VILYPHKQSGCLYAKYDKFSPIFENVDKQKLKTYEQLSSFGKRIELLLKNTVNFTFSLLRVRNIKSKEQSLVLLLNFEAI